MKTKQFFLAFLAIPAFCACAQLAPESTIKTIPCTLTASIDDADDATKTYCPSGNKVYWSGSDKISVFDSAGNNNEFTVVDPGAATAEFTGSITDGSEPTYAVYPYAESNSISSEGVFTVSAIKDGNFVAANDNSIVKGKNISIGKVVNGAVYFRNATGFFKVAFKHNGETGDGTVGEAGRKLTDVEKVEFYADEVVSKEVKPLVATLDVNYNEGVPTVTSKSDANPKISVSPKKKSGASNVSYVLANVIPATYTGISAVVTDKDGNIKTYHKSGAVTVERNKYLDFGTVGVDDGTVTATLEANTNVFEVKEFNGNPTYGDTYAMDKTVKVDDYDWSIKGMFSFNTGAKALQSAEGSYIKLPQKAGYKPVSVVVYVGNKVANSKPLSIWADETFATEVTGGSQRQAYSDKPAIFALKGTTASGNYYIKLTNNNNQTKKVVVGYVPAE